MRTPCRRLPALLTASLLLPLALLAAETVPLPDTADLQWPPQESLLRETRAAMDRAGRYLLQQQHEDGHWSDPTFPALTALPLWALADSGTTEDDAVQRARDFILSCVHTNGAIYRKPSFERKGGGLKNYNTALCMVALHRLQDPALVPVIQRARAYLAGTQHFGDDIYHGGMGYDADTGRAYTDLSNSTLAFEAMRLTEDVEDLRPAGEERVDLDWEAAQGFVQRVHNHPDFNDQPWVTDDPADQGGFAYHPENTRAGTVTNARGVVQFRSFGSMTYAGMLSYIYAEVDRDDPRVQTTFDWIRRHWDLSQNVNTGQEGLYYYYNVLAKGLHAFGRNRIEPAEGAPFLWRTEYLEALLSRQRIDPQTGDGYWLNDVGRYWENNPVLVTAYALIGMNYALGDVPSP